MRPIRNFGSRSADARLESGSRELLAISLRRGFAEDSGGVRAVDSRGDFGNHCAPVSSWLRRDEPMTQPRSAPTTLLGLLTAPDDRIALIQPDGGIRITYGNLRKQVQDVASALAAAGVKRGDRIGMA